MFVGQRKKISRDNLSQYNKWPKRKKQKRLKRVKKEEGN